MSLQTSTSIGNRDKCSKMSTEAVERSSVWADETVVRLIGIRPYEKIQRQLDMCS